MGIKRKLDTTNDEKPEKLVKLEKEDVGTEKALAKSKKKSDGKKSTQDGKKKTEGKSGKVVAGKSVELSKKERKLKYKSTKNNFDLTTKAKQLWEVLRNSANKAKSEELAKELHNLIKGKANQLIYAHDTSRVIECLMALGSTEIKNSLFEEMKDEIIKMSQSTYAKFFVLKILNYGTKEQRNKVISSFYGNVVKLVKHSIAASVVEIAYNDYANKHQRDNLIQEFYGPLYKMSKTSDDQTLATILEIEKERKKLILGSMEQALLTLNGKSVIRHSIVHKMLMDYFNHCNENSRQDMIEIIRERVVEILHTHDGSRVAMKCVWHGTRKDRKVIIKSLKTHVVKICHEKDGYLVLLALFDCFDDTKMVKSIVLEELLKNLKDVIFHSEGRKIILYLLAPRNTVYFHPDVIRILEEGDTNQTSKKDKDIRQKELLESVSARLLRFFIENTKDFIFNSSNSIVGKAILNHCLEDRKEAFQSVARLVAEPYPSTDSSTPHIIENTPSHLFLKHLLKADRELKSESDLLFSKSLLEIVPPENFVKWIECNRGSFILTFMIETENKEVISVLKEILEPIKKKLIKKSKSFSGAKEWHQFSRNLTVSSDHIMVKYEKKTAESLHFEAVTFGNCEIAMHIEVPSSMEV